MFYKYKRKLFAKAPIPKKKEHIIEKKIQKYNQKRINLNLLNQKKLK